MRVPRWLLSGVENRHEILELRMRAASINATIKHVYELKDSTPTTIDTSMRTGPRIMRYYISQIIVK